MDLDSLRKEIDYEPNYYNFCRIIRCLEKSKVVESFKHPFNRKKYLYLGQVGENQLSTNENPTAISKDTLIHDLKVSELARSFLNLRWVESAELEHKLTDKRNFKVNYKIIPDALLQGRKNGTHFRIALELELTRKNNQRIVEKARLYQDSSYYDYVMYVFSKQNVMDKYIEILQDELGENNLSHFMFFIDKNMTCEMTDLRKMEGYFNSKQLRLSDLFEQLNTC
jgi:hypothetical protein